MWAPYCDIYAPINECENNNVDKRQQLSFEDNVDITKYVNFIEKNKDIMIKEKK